MSSRLITLLPFPLYSGAAFGLASRSRRAAAFSLCWALWACTWRAALFAGFWRMAGRWRLRDVSAVRGAGGAYGTGAAALSAIVASWLRMEKRRVGRGKEGGAGGKAESITWGNNKHPCLDRDLSFTFHSHAF